MTEWVELTECVRLMYRACCGCSDEGGSMRLLIEGDALARFCGFAGGGGDTGGTLAEWCPWWCGWCWAGRGSPRESPPASDRIGSNICPLDAGLGVDGALTMCEMLAFW